MRSWYTAQELAGLPGMPGTERAIQIRAQREGWEGQRRLGSKAVEYAFAVLPAPTQAALIAATVGSAVATVAPAQPLVKRAISAVRDVVKASRLNESQHSTMTARVAIVREVERIGLASSQQRAIDMLLALAKSGELSPYLADCMTRANDRLNADRGLSERTLKRWLADFKKYGETGLAPSRREQDLRVPSWAGAFLACYQLPQKPSVEASYAAFAGKTEGERPSIHAVRRWLKKLSPEAREHGRMGPHDIKAYKACVRMKTGNLWPNDVWQMDGHTFDAEVMNPISGQIFRPEITLAIDWATRRIVGFSVNLAESTMATLDTLRDAITRVGMYDNLYVDNGSGFANAVVYEVNDRLGGTITHSLPYNSQARGVIERVHKSILVRLAKTYSSYIGKDMDKEAGTKTHKLSRKQLKAGLKPTVVPEFTAFFADLQDALDGYNRQPHSSLNKVRDENTGQMRHLSPMDAWKRAQDEGWEALVAEPEVIANLTRPQVTRTTLRGEVRFNSAKYFLDDLAAIHGDEVRVAYDFRDASRVWVHSLDGDLIGEALLDGNAKDVKSVFSKKVSQRENGQVARLATKGRVITGKDVEVRVIEPVERGAQPCIAARAAEGMAMIERLTAEQANAFEIPADAVARYRVWHELQARVEGEEVLTEEEARWHGRYPSHQDFTAMRQVHEHAELLASA